MKHPKFQMVFARIPFLKSMCFGKDSTWFLQGCNSAKISTDRNQGKTLIFQTVSVDRFQVEISIYLKLSADGRHFDTNELIQSVAARRNPNLLIHHISAALKVKRIDIPCNQTKATIKTQNPKDKIISWNRET